MRMRDSREVRPDKADLAALVDRIHEDLRKERKARRWRENAPERKKTALVALILLIPIAIGLYLATVI